MMTNKNSRPTFLNACMKFLLLTSVHFSSTLLCNSFYSLCLVSHGSHLLPSCRSFIDVMGRESELMQLHSPEARSIAFPSYQFLPPSFFAFLRCFVSLHTSPPA